MSEINQQEIVNKFDELREMLLADHPRMPQLLREIHATAARYPEQMVIVSDEHWAAVFQGLERVSGTLLEAKASTPKKSARGKGVTLDDI